MKVQHYKTSNQRRRIKIRSKISGTAETPRLSVFRSNTHVYAQLIDDVSGKTLAASSDTVLSLKNKTKTDEAFEVGKDLAQKAVKVGIKSAVFDRSGFKYHGRVKALADGAREGGLIF